MAKKTRIYSKNTLQAIKLFASLIKIARKKHGWSAAELAERAGTTRPTIHKIEQASPVTEIGLYFEIAYLLGIPLFSVGQAEMAALQGQLDLQLAVLPKRIDSAPSEVFDDF